VGTSHSDAKHVFLSSISLDVFTGGYRAHQVRVWDVRARSMLYELLTGNNVVRHLAWDPANQTLYAATECSRLDRLGRHSGYRAAKVKKAEATAEDIQEDDRDEGWEDVEDDERIGNDDQGRRQKWDFTEFADDNTYEEVAGRAWPKIAWHNEESFGLLFDAGNHRLSELTSRRLLHTCPAR
jgi:hypothetical protein